MRWPVYLILCFLALRPAQAAGASAAFEKFDAFQKDLVAHNVPGKLQQFIDHNEFTPRELVDTLDDAYSRHRGPFFALMVNVYLHTKTQAMEPRERANLMLKIARLDSQHHATVAVLPTYDEARIDARFKYFRRERKDLEIDSKREMADLAGRAADEPSLDSSSRDRARYYQAALIPDEDGLADLIRKDKSGHALQGTERNPSLVARVKVLDAVVASDDNEDTELPKGHLLAVLRNLQSADPRIKERAGRKLHALAQFPRKAEHSGQLKALDEPPKKRGVK